MVRGTDTIFTIVLDDIDGVVIDANDLTDIHVTFSQEDGNLIDKTGDDVSVTDYGEIRVTLSQLETLLFFRGRVKAQARFRWGGQVRATAPVMIEVSDNILKGVI